MKKTWNPSIIDLSLPGIQNAFLSGNILKKSCKVPDLPIQKPVQPHFRKFHDFIFMKNPCSINIRGFRYAKVSLFNEIGAIKPYFSK